MAQCLEVYRGGDRAKTIGKGPKMFKNQKKGNVAHRLGGLGREEIADKEGQGWCGLWWEEDQEGRTKESSVPQLWWRLLLAGLQGVEGN